VLFDHFYVAGSHLSLGLIVGNDKLDFSRKGHYDLVPFLHALRQSAVFTPWILSI
jgi:hypothetical protein